jgi:hypothetical protein
MHFHAAANTFAARRSFLPVLLIIGNIQGGLNGESGNPTAMTFWKPLNPN